MTDNDIIKALECCSSENGKDDCLTCPNFKDFVDCKEDLSAIALDLIKRLQERIKKLENIERFATKTIKKQEKEIERLTVELKIKSQKRANIFEIADAFERGRAEAIKEFAERFEKKIKDVKFTIGQTWEIQCALKQTLKEMTEGSKNG